MRQQVWQPPRSSQPSYLRSLTTDTSATGKSIKWHVLQRASTWIGANEASDYQNSWMLKKPASASRHPDSKRLPLSEQAKLENQSRSHYSYSPDENEEKPPVNHLQVSVNFSDAHYPMENVQTLSSNACPLDRDHSGGTDSLMCRSEFVQGTSINLLDQAPLPQSKADTTVLLTFLRETLSEVAHLEKRIPSTAHGGFAKNSIFTSDFQRLLGQLEDSVLDFVMLDTVAELTRIGIATTTLVDTLSEQVSSEVPITASNFLEQCVKFELDLQDRYARQFEHFG